MHRLLARNNAQCDISAMSAQGNDEAKAWRLLSLYNAACDPAGEIQAMMAKCHAQAIASELWQELEHTGRMASQVFSASYRSAATTFLLRVRLQGFPYVTLALLRPDADVNEFLAKAQAQRCLLDEWTVHFLESYPTRELLASMDARIELGMMADGCVGNIYPTETQHSRHSRRSRGRAMTHVMALADVTCVELRVGCASICSAAGVGLHDCHRHVAESLKKRNQAGDKTL